MLRQATRRIKAGVGTCHLYVLLSYSFTAASSRLSPFGTMAGRAAATLCQPRAVCCTPARRWHHFTTHSSQPCDVFSCVGAQGRLGRLQGSRVLGRARLRAGGGCKGVRVRPTTACTQQPRRSRAGAASADLAGRLRLQGGASPAIAHVEGAEEGKGEKGDYLSRLVHGIRIDVYFIS